LGRVAAPLDTPAAPALGRSPTEDEMREDYPIREEPGWYGAFTRAQAPGAWPNGATVEKILSEPRDPTPDGARGQVLGSLDPESMAGVILYFVEWTAQPKVAVACLSRKLRLVAA
jgi:hypothetical protein